MAAWPGEEIEERAAEIASAAGVLLRRSAGWRHRRVETITVLTHEQVRRHVSVDFTVPEEYRESLRLSVDEYVVPLALLAKRPLVHFDLRNEEGHSIPLLTADQNRMIGRELLYQALDADLEEQDADAETLVAATPLIEAVLADDVRQLSEQIDELERERGLEPLSDFRAAADTLSRNFILWAIVRGLDRRRVFKFAHDEGFAQRPALSHFYATPGCTQAATFHVEVAVPPGLRARSTDLFDDATGALLRAGARDADRPAIYFVADPQVELQRPGLLVQYGAERWRFLGPAALVATVICLLVALPWLFADLHALAAQRRCGDRPRALDVGGVLRARAADRRAPAAARDARALPAAARRLHARRAVRRRGARFPRQAVDPRDHLGARRGCFRACRRYPDH